MGAPASPFSADTFRKVLAEFLSAPDTQVGPDARAAVDEFLKSNPTDQQVYDFMVNFRIQFKSSISSFTAAICDLKRYYTRPD